MCQQLKKPNDLKGVKQIGSAQFCKAKCPVFVGGGNHIYVKHNDYFSPYLQPQDEDIGAPLSVLVQKYLGKVRREKFIYANCWGTIVMRRRAWLAIENGVPALKKINVRQFALEITRQTHGWMPGMSGQPDVDCEWERFWMEVAALIQKDVSGK